MNKAASRIYAAEGNCFVLVPCATVSREMVEMFRADDPARHQLLLEAALHGDTPPTSK